MLAINVPGVSPVACPVPFAVPGVRAWKQKQHSSAALKPRFVARCLSRSPLKGPCMNLTHGNLQCREDREVKCHVPTFNIQYHTISYKDKLEDCSSHFHVLSFEGQNFRT